MVLLLAWSAAGQTPDKNERSSAPGRDAAPVLWPVSPGPGLEFSTNAVPNIRLSPWTREIVKLAQVGIDEDVMLSFIDNSGMFNLGADQIIYLSDLGVPADVISEMLRHDSEVISGARRLTIASEPPRDPLLHFTFKSGGTEAAKSDPQPAVASAPQAAAKSAPIVVSDERTSTEVSSASANSMQSGRESARAFEPVSDLSGNSDEQNRSSAKIGSYPVREPYPVQLTAPIIFVQAAEPPASTYFIEWFPQADR